MYLAHSTFLTFLACLASCIAEVTNESLPTVDLGYEIHRAISFDEAYQTYNFSNVRFAQPPVGKLRFAKPVPPTGVNPEIQDGSKGAICPPSMPIWTALQTTYATGWATNNASLLNYQTAQAASNAALAIAPDAAFDFLSKSVLSDPRISEDCLFLDVVTPKSAFEQANKTSPGLPVVIYVFGGGFVGGDKTSVVPTPFISSARDKGTDGIVWVAINYRLGALGFLAGSSLQDAGGVANAGFYDQELAIDWVYDNIHKFGGNPNDITLFGGSAGGGSIMHQITAYGGQRSVKFSKAIALYPGWLPQPSEDNQETNAQGFLKYLNVNTVEEARDACSEEVILAQLKQVAISPSGTFAFGPAVDGSFAPELPGVLLAKGAYAKNVTVLTSYSENDGVNFAPADVLTDLDFHLYLRRVEPTIQQDVADHIVNDLYPSVFDGSHPYDTPFGRIAQFVRDFAFACNTHYLSQALNSYLYEWAVPPATHGSDLPSWQYVASQNESSPAPLWHTELPGYFVNFILTGDPNKPNDPDLPHWPGGKDLSINVFNASSILAQKDSIPNATCAYVQNAPYA